MFFNSEDFDVQPWRSVHPSEEALKRWRSACAIVKNRRRRFCMVTNLANHAEARDHKLKIQDDQEIGSEKTLRRWRSACNGRRSFHKLAGLDEHIKLQSNEDVPSSEYIVNEADTKARRFQEPIDDVGSTISGLDEQVTVSPVVLKAVLHCTENLSLRSNEDVPSSEYVVTEAANEGRIFQEPVDDVGSTVNGLEICELLGKYKKRALAVFYLVLEAASFLLDIFGKSKRSILLAAFLLSASGFAITLSMHFWTVTRTIAATRMYLQKQLLMVLEISFSLVQVHIPNITGDEDPEANGSMPMLADFR